MWSRALRSLLSVILVAIGLAATGFTVAALATVYLAAVTPWLAATDIREHRLPNVLVVPAIAIGLVTCAAEWINTAHPPLTPLIAGIAYPAFLLLLHLTGGMGMGDVKLGAALGLSSWSAPVAILSPVVAFLVGGFVALVFLIVGRRGTRIAFGPYLLGGYWLAVSIAALYRSSG
jgi:leader peptidase (prepilin peptidase)/N-methyltransferase